MMSCATTSQIYNPPKKMVVKAVVTDVRAKLEPHSGEYKFDPLQETQLEQGEPVEVYERQGDWARIAAPEQLEYSHNSRWEGYPGWVKWADLSSDLSLHHRIKKENLSTPKHRELVIEYAAKHIGNPYLWGGRSLHNPTIKNTVTGVDCSGLVNWSFRQTGWFVPRDAHEQFLKSRRLTSKELKQGDLIFLAKPDNKEKIVHVMFYAGADEILEAPQSGENVRRISSQERFGKSILDIKDGEQVGDRVIFFGTFFPE